LNKKESIKENIKNEEEMTKITYQLEKLKEKDKKIEVI